MMWVGNTLLLISLTFLWHEASLYYYITLYKGGSSLCALIFFTGWILVLLCIYFAL